MKIKRGLKLLCIFVISSCMMFTGGCKSVREFGNGVYYNESDSSIYLTVSDCKDTPDSPEFDKQCKIQFSDNFDIFVYEKQLAYLYAIFHSFDLIDNVESLSEEESNKLFEQSEKEYLDHVDLKKQFVDNAATFYYVREDGEKVASLYAYVDGSDFYSDEGEKDHIIINIDENGALILDYGTEDDNDLNIFK